MSFLLPPAQRRFKNTNNPNNPNNPKAEGPGFVAEWPEKNTRRGGPPAVTGGAPWGRQTASPDRVLSERRLSGEREVAEQTSNLNRPKIDTNLSNSTRPSQIHTQIAHSTHRPVTHKKRRVGPYRKIQSQKWNRSKIDTIILTPGSDFPSNSGLSASFFRWSANLFASQRNPENV